MSSCPSSHLSASVMLSTLSCAKCHCELARQGSDISRCSRTWYLGHQAATASPGASHRNPSLALRAMIPENVSAGQINLDILLSVAKRSSHYPCE